MNVVRRNAIANYLGQGWTALMGLAFVPFYIRYLGMEAYGLVGIFVVLQSWMALLDMGLAPTLGREMARFSAGAHTPHSIRDLLRTIEIIYAVFVLLAAIAIWLLAPWLANYWLNTSRLPAEVIAQALSIVGLVVGLRWWEGLYRGAIQGLQRMVWLNATSAIFAVIRWGGAAAILAWVSPTIHAFFIWQGVVSLLVTSVFGVELYRTVPAADRTGRFSPASLGAIWRFSGGLALITLLATLLTQIDKVLLSGLLSLESFGYYMLAVTIGSVLFQLVYPLANAMYPRFTELSTRGQQESLVASYHRSCQAMSVLTIPPALILMTHAYPLLLLWTHDAGIAQEVAPLIVPLVLGTLLNGFMNLPYVLQLAHGWTGLTIRVNVIAVSFIVPAILWATPRYGAQGAAYAWLALNAGYVLISVHFMHRRIFPLEKVKWYWEDIGFPLVLTSSAAWLLRIIMPVGLSDLGQLLWIGFTGIVLVGVAIMSSSEWRSELYRRASCRVRKIQA